MSIDHANRPGHFCRHKGTALRFWGNYVRCRKCGARRMADLQFHTHWQFHRQRSSKRFRRVMWKDMR